MLRKIFIFTFFIFLNLVLIVNTFAKENNSSEIITGTYQYSAIEGNNKQNQNTFLYKDSDFTKSSFLGSKSLEVLSIQVASASLSWYGPELDEYELDSSQNDYNIRNLLEAMKFNSIEANKYYNSEKKENSVGVIIGHKTIMQAGKEYTLLAIIPRSAGYKQEWAGNFTIGDQDLHEGFKSARDEILRFTKQYMEKNDIKGDLKVWTVGYSRGAAISNMVGGFFAGGGIDYFGGSVRITPEDVYCYTIGTPSSVKDGADKNIELSVSANRSQADYANDTVGEAFTYTKGGKVSVSDSQYNGIRSIISSDDAFALLPLEQWGFTRYGRVVASDEGLSSEEEMLEELATISEYVYEAYTSDGKINKFTEKKFDLKTLSIVDKESNVSQIEFFKGRLNGLATKIKTNKIYNDEYQEALKSTIGTYGMAATLIGSISDSTDMEISQMIYPLIYTYLAYVSDELQSEGRANNETEAVAIAIQDILTYFTGTEIDENSFKVDDFVKIVMKYVADNEDEPISDMVVSGIIDLVPDNYKVFLSMFNVFSTNPDSTTEESLKAFIRACYYGTDPESAAYEVYKTPEETRQLLYMTMAMVIGTDMPEIADLIRDSNGNLDGHGSFEDFVDLMLIRTRQEKDENGTIIKTYTNMAELADKELIDLLDNLLQEAINQSEELYGIEYRNDFQKQFNNMKQNITKVREILSTLFFYTKDGYKAGESIENTLTLVQNALLIAMPHFDEIYLALSRTSDRYINNYEYETGAKQIIEENNEGAIFIIDADYSLFITGGEVYVDDVLVDSNNYISESGSTKITLKKDYLDSLSKGEHTLKVVFNDGGIAETTFTTTINNPQTSDNIMLYALMFGISIIGLIRVKKKYIY